MSAFGRVLAAEGISNFGSMLSRLAIPWIATLVLDATPLAMSALVVADVAAAALASLVLGGLVDRRDKRATMLACDLLRAAVLALLALLAWTGGLTLPALIAAAAASAVLTIGFELARSAWIAQHFEADQLPRRNAQLSITGSLSETAAFALGGWLYQWSGAVIALAVDALSYVGSALCLRGVLGAPAVAAPAVEAPAPHGVPLRCSIDDAKAGLGAVLAHPTLRALAAIEVLLALAGSIAATSYMIFVARDIGFATGSLGTIFAAGGLGSIAGAAIGPWLGRRLRPGRAMAIGLSLAALGAAFIPMATSAGLVGIALLVAHQIVGDGGRTVHDVHDRTLRQTSAPPALLARVDAGIRSAGQLATLVGAIGGGALASALGTRTALWMSAALIAAAACTAMIALARR